MKAEGATTSFDAGFTTQLPNGCDTDIEDPTTAAYYEMRRVFLIVVMKSLFILITII